MQTYILKKTKLKHWSFLIRYFASELCIDRSPSLYTELAMPLIFHHFAPFRHIYVGLTASAVLTVVDELAELGHFGQVVELAPLGERHRAVVIVSSSVDRVGGWDTELSLDLGHDEGHGDNAWDDQKDD